MLPDKLRETNLRLSVSAVSVGSSQRVIRSTVAGITAGNVKRW